MEKPPQTRPPRAPTAAAKPGPMKSSVKKSPVKKSPAKKSPAKKSAAATGASATKHSGSAKALAKRAPAEKQVAKRATRGVTKRAEAKSAPVSAAVPAAAAKVEQAAEAGCRHCGGQPAANVEFRVVRGLLRSYHRSDLPGPWCVDCGEATYRTAMNRTLVGAWWGNRSFFGGIAAVRANRKSRRATAALSPPVRTAESPGPQDPGRPLWQRSGALIGAAMTFVLVFAAIGIALLAGETPADQFADTCIRLDERAETVATVSCGNANDGKVLEIVTDEADCPAAATAIVTLTEDADKLLCVDDTR